MNTTELAVEIRPEKSSGPYGIWTHDLCDTEALHWYRRGHAFKSRTGLREKEREGGREGFLGDHMVTWFSGVNGRGISLSTPT